MRSDVVIVGGGIMGCALAYWLTRDDPKISVTIVERDPTYENASSALSASSIRQQFTTAVNIRISQSSIRFLREADELLQVAGSKPDIGLTEEGYLYLAGGSQLGALRRAHAIQTAEGADVALLDAGQLSRQFPWLKTDDLAAASLGRSGEGWFDGYSLLRAFGAKARSQGAKFLRGEVVEMVVQRARIETLVLQDGTRISADVVVNAAGPWARQVGKLAGVDLPVVGRTRTVYFIRCQAGFGHFPLLIDTSGFWIRPEGAGFIAGMSPAEDSDDAPLEPDYPAFEAVLWPALAARIPAFEAAKLERAWCGYYEMNVFDQNGIVGFHPQRDNLLLMNGFSGHGIQQAPVVGRGVAELIREGRFVSVDLSDLGFDRIAKGRPLVESNVI